MCSRAQCSINDCLSRVECTFACDCVWVCMCTPVCKYDRKKVFQFVHSLACSWFSFRPPTWTQPYTSTPIRIHTHITFPYTVVSSLGSLLVSPEVWKGRVVGFAYMRFSAILRSPLLQCQRCWSSILFLFSRPRYYVNHAAGQDRFSAWDVGATSPVNLNLYNLFMTLFPKTVFSLHEFTTITFPCFN